MDAINVLALHGYHGSARILRQQIQPLDAALPSSINLTYVDAPSLPRGDFGWWHEGFSGWERTRDWVIDLAGQQHFHGVIGFSQGAALAGLLTAVQERASDTARGDGLGFRFAVMIGGFTSDAPQHADLFTRPLTTPSLHVTGSKDSIVPMRDSLRLAGRFADPVLVQHGGGHVIPDEPEVVGRIVDFAARHAAALHTAVLAESAPDGGRGDA
ncbi:hypothetical protein ACFXDH_52630 [Streptomyces sp. NPDC059467]|uniref:hypothetical protein n=1 Tax=Streptomyces sp. NPDC059467 TaxID=3346844 RepID=UPI0036C3F79D